LTFGAPEGFGLVYRHYSHHDWRAPSKF